MSTFAFIQSDRQILSTHHQNPLMSVLVWEFHRFRHSLSFWIQALSFFGLVFFMLWATQSPGYYHGSLPNGNPFNISVAGTSIWGFLRSLQAGLLLLPGLFLPFINADGITRDRQQRTHELLMTTSVPDWAYVWGRYLSGLLISMGLAALMLIAILSMYLLLHLTVANDPPPQVGAVLILWAGMIVPATILLSSVSFFLGTIFPHQSMQIKVSILLAWIIEVVFLYSILDPIIGTPVGYSAWDITSAATVNRLLVPYEPHLLNQLPTATSLAQVQHILLGVENSLPNLSSWLATHMIESLFSLMLVLLVSFAFRRFRTA